MSNSVEKILTGPAGYALAIAVGGIVLYALYSKAKSDIGKAAGATSDALFGTTPAQNSTNADGTPQTAYSGHGALGTLGAAVNNLLGGIPSSIGENVGGWLFDHVGPSVDKSNPNGVAATSKQYAVDSNSPNIGNVGVPLDYNSNYGW